VSACWLYGGSSSRDIKVFLMINLFQFYMYHLQHNSLLTIKSSEKRVKNKQKVLKTTIDICHKQYNNFLLDKYVNESLMIVEDECRLSTAAGGEEVRQPVTSSCHFEITHFLFMQHQKFTLHKLASMTNHHYHPTIHAVLGVLQRQAEKKKRYIKLSETNLKTLYSRELWLMNDRSCCCN
jgi:hypothetical protein